MKKRYRRNKSLTKTKVFAQQEKHFSKKGKCTLHKYEINKKVDLYHGDSVYIAKEQKGRRTIWFPRMEECGINIQYDSIDNRINFDDGDF